MTNAHKAGGTMPLPANTTRSEILDILALAGIGNGPGLDLFLDTLTARLEAGK